jgi:hypothetical protein
MEGPTAYDRRDLKAFVSEMYGGRPPDGNPPLTGPDSNIYEYSDRFLDLVALRPRRHEDSFSSWVVNKAIHKIFACCRSRLKPSKIHGMRGCEEETLFRITYGITSVIASILPSASIIVLYLVRSMWARLAVLAVFNLTISICLTALTSARRADVFAITAAYVGLELQA